MTKTIIECNKLCKTYVQHKAVDQLSFMISKGEKVILLGANGAGKTTTLKLLLGLESPTSGSVKLNQLNPILPKARIDIGVMPQESDFIDELTTLETIQFIKKHYKETFSIDELLNIFMLDTFKNTLTAKLSLGQKRRLALALAFINKPKVVFLDEPTVGLDVESRNQILSFIHDYTAQSEITLLLTTHYLEEADRLAERVIYLQKGQIQSDTLIQQFKSKIVQTQIHFYCDIPLLDKTLLGISSQIKQDENQIILWSEDSDQVVRYLVNNNVPFYGLKILPPSLETAYLTREREKTC